jgi:hypothetical protein
VTVLSAASAPRPAAATRVDALIAAVVFTAGFLVGASYFRTVMAAGGQPWFYQVDFGPAVMAACGHGFQVPDDAQIPRLAEFLQTKVDRFSCADLPEKPPLRSTQGAQPWLAWAHLIRSAGIVWQWSGISWAGLAPIAGVFLGATAALSFVLLRLALGRVLALVGALAIMTSPLMLTQLPYFRDFSKVPFMLAIAWVFAQLIASSIPPRRLLALAAAYGVALGVSLGFRTDPLITVPLFVILVVCARTPTAGLRTKALAVVVAAVLSLVTVSPVLRVFTQGGGAFISHAALLGLMDPVDTALGIAPDKPYEVGYGLTDTYAAAVVSAAATRAAGEPVAILGHSPEYDAASAAYLRSVLLALPADVIARAYAATLRVVSLPSAPVNHGPPTHIGSPLALSLFAARASVAAALGPYWWPLLVVALLLVAARDIRLAITLSALYAYFTTYSVVQFHQRHIMHLELIGIAAMLFVLQTVVWRDWRGSLMRVMVFLVAALAVVTLPLLAARWYQQRALTRMFNAYQAAPTTPIAMRSSPLDDGRVQLVREDDAAGEWARTHRDAVLTEYLVLELGVCEMPLTMTLRYDGTADGASFEREYHVPPPPSGHVTRLMIGTFAYRHSTVDIWYHWRGFDMPADHTSCLQRVSKITSPERFPVLLNATLTPGWDQRPLYARLGAPPANR